jgi:hypothetical protein
LNSASRPTNPYPGFEEKEVKHYFAKFGLSFQQLKNDFRDYKDGGGGERSAVKSNLQHLVSCTDTLPIITNACQQGFSGVNLVRSSLYSQLSPENLAALMLVSLKPLPYALRWNVAGEQQNGCLRCTACPKKRVTKTEHNAALASPWKFTQDMQQLYGCFCDVSRCTVCCVRSRTGLVVGCRFRRSGQGRI